MTGGVAFTLHLQYLLVFFIRFLSKMFPWRRCLTGYQSPDRLMYSIPKIYFDVSYS